MQINNLHVASLSLGKAGEAAGAEEVDRRRRTRRGIIEVSRHTPSAELVRWLTLVQKHPDIRLEVLERAAQHLAAGLYLSRAAALQTAEAMLRSPE